jgi:hypothetical protein
MNDKVSRTVRPMMTALGLSVVLTIALVISGVVGPGALIALGPEFYLLFRNAFH